MKEAPSSYKTDFLTEFLLWSILHTQHSSSFSTCTSEFFPLLYQNPYPHCFPYPYVLIRTPLISHLPIICGWSLNCCSEFQLITELSLPIYSIFMKILENSYLAHLVLPFLFCFIMHLWIIQKIQFNPTDHNHSFSLIISIIIGP